MHGKEFSYQLSGAVLAAAISWGCLSTSAVTPRVAAKPQGPERRVDPGILVVAPDRGFLGNEETRDAFEGLRDHNAELVFATDERTRASLEPALRALGRRGARRVVVLPLFISSADPRLGLVRKLLGQAPAGEPGESPPAPSAPLPISMGRPFGESYLAAEILADRFRDEQPIGGRRLVVVGYGADDEETRSRMTEDWLRLARHAAEGFGFESVRVVVADDLSGQAHEEKLRAFSKSLARAVDGGERPIVVPFHLGHKYDGMMGFSAELRHVLPRGAELLEGEVTPHADVATWLRREANRHAPLSPQDVGVVVLAHGADFHWNETMREAARPLAERYPIEFAFCMADTQIVERAVRKLERRGVRAIVVARVFALESSFRGAVERMLGVDVEGASSAHTHHAQPLGHHDHGAHGPPAPRIRSEAILATVGGLEADPLFAKALLERARELSRDPDRETLILVGHGAGEDSRDRHWLKILENLSSEMRANGGASFRAIRVATWREDWPEKRRPSVEKVRQWVEEASRDGGRAIVIPARTNGQGREREFLAGLTFELGEGFAPHPLFARWLENEIDEGISALRDGFHRHGHAPPKTDVVTRLKR